MTVNLFTTIFFIWTSLGVVFALLRCGQVWLTLNLCLILGSFGVLAIYAVFKVVFIL